MAETNKEAKAKQKREYHRLWRRKGRGLGLKGSSTPGKTKRADTCQATEADRFCAKYARARKMNGYTEWLDAHRIR